MSEELETARHTTPADRKAGRIKRTIAYRWSPEIMASICDQVREGATLVEVCDGHDMPTLGQVNQQCIRDPDFAAALADASASLAAICLDEAMDYAREASGTGDIDDMRRAQAMMQIAATYSEKVAPKRYGQLLKLGQAEELGPLAVSVVSYAVKVAAPQPLKVIDIDTDQEGPKARTA